MYSFAIYNFFGESSIQIFCHFLLGLLICGYFVVLYTFWYMFQVFFFPICGLFSNRVFKRAKGFSFDDFDSILSFLKINHDFGVVSKSSLPTQSHETFLLCFPLRVQLCFNVNYSLFFRSYVTLLRKPSLTTQTRWDSCVIHL